MSSQSPEEVAEGAVEYLRERTRADPGLIPEERETTLTFAVDEETARVHSEEASIIRRLLSHDDVDVRRLGVHDGETTRTVSYDDALAEMGADDLVVRLQGRIPLRYLVVKDVGRNHDDHAVVVSKGVFDE